MTSIDDWLIQATCAVLKNDRVVGTAWLVDKHGFLLTAGHVVGDQEPLPEIVSVRFEDRAPCAAHVIAWEHDQARALDFAVLKLETVDAWRQPLQCSLEKDVTDKDRFCAYGYGVGLRARAKGVGKFIGPYDWNNSLEYRLFECDSKQLSEPGFSGAAIYSYKSQAIVGIQTLATKNNTGANRDIILALPLYRIAAKWPLLEQIAVKSSSASANGRSLDTRIMIALYVCGQAHPGRQGTELNELLEHLDIDISTDLHIDLRRLEEFGWLHRKLADDGTLGSIELTGQGLRVARDLLEPKRP